MRRTRTIKHNVDPCEFCGVICYIPAYLTFDGKMSGGCLRQKDKQAKDHTKKLITEAERLLNPHDNKKDTNESLGGGADASGA